MSACRIDAEHYRVRMPTPVQLTPEQVRAKALLLLDATEAANCPGGICSNWLVRVATGIGYALVYLGDVTAANK